MQTKQFLTLTLACLLVVLAGHYGAARDSRHRDRESSTTSEPQEVTFSLTRQPENARQYSLVISDDEEHVVSGTFSISQLQILRAMMTEAEKFALEGQPSDAKDPVTTRFADKQESAFIVDVEKTRNQSDLFLTLNTETGRITVKAGRVIRSTRREEGFFFDLLSRLETVLPKQ